ncbi:helix-turn-helix domain-containing protein [Actinomadura harenae]|uniref:XRE family transcriptional regulator n=1 Tax=Actinomadura harenae TaxID=2483351 RepID=A0A3M2LJ59_9ACTN|nr:helix-turn-helix transcriptional regulator [Actinomadura harenae]RMI37504.1 XRE family transcriptional regulator [Actinomadura harenae]
MDSSQQRRCTSCGSTLSRYSAGTRCGPCQRGLHIAPEFWDEAPVQQAVAAWDLGALCRLIRSHTGLSQAAFARIVSSDQSEISRLERGQRIIKDRRRVLQWAQVLNFPEHLAGQLPSRPERTPSGIEPTFSAPRVAADAEPRQLHLPAGKSLTGGALPTLTLSADSFHGNELHIRRGAELDGWMRTPSRALLVVTRTIDGASRQFAADTRYVTRANAAPGDRDHVLRVPAAYELDDLTFGIVWAVAGFDAALLGDDAGLHAVLPLTGGVDLDPLFSAVRDEDLTPGSLMFVGSQTSARYILDQYGPLGDAPVFWTREQTGEEAATWLLFTHKLDYLRRTAPPVPEPKATIGRAFCIPAEVVARSPGYERVLLFLAIALMESLGITTWITEIPDLADTDGFVLIPRRGAIIASWVRAEGVSKLGRTMRPAELHAFADAIGHTAAHSVTAADLARDRLIATADYLQLDWGWATRRCRQLASVGTAALARPRSHLMGLEGLDTACRFVASQHPLNR